MKDLEIVAAIKACSLLVCCGPYRETFFVPLHQLPFDYVEARPKLNSRYLENGMFQYYGCKIADCRLATPKEIELFNQLKNSSKFNNSEEKK